MGGALHDVAYAKLNLALHVRGRRADGYHDIETLFAFLDDGDRLSAERADRLTLRIIGPFAGDLADCEDNLVLQAARLLAERNGISTGAAFTLDKRLPIAAGLGGGSADAAAAMRLLAKLWRLDDRSVQPVEVAAELGADVPACITSETCIGTKAGDELNLEDAPDVRGMSVLLINPLVECPTGPVFGAWDGLDRGALDARNWPAGRNDLQPAAMALVPEIDDVLAVLQAQLPRVARMSGSGATCFAVFDDEQQRDAAARRIVDDHPEWWVMAGKLR